MKKAKALALAQKAHSKPYKNGVHSWAFTAPHKTTEPLGACVEVQTPDYRAAESKRAKRVASLALELIGLAPEDAEALTYDTTGTARYIVNQAVKRIKPEK